MTVTVSLPLPPTANRMYIHTQRGVVKSEAARAYRNQITDICRRATLLPYTGPVAVHLTIYRPRKAGDIDNYQKVLFDALQGLLYRKDSQIVATTARLDDTRPKQSGVTVTVEELL